MSKEIERKFLVVSDVYKSKGVAERYVQGYLCSLPERIVRMRIAGKRAFLTIKGKMVGISRDEYEYQIPLNDAHEILDKLCEKPLIEKDRWIVTVDNLVWIVDEFHGENEGLAVAELELKDETQPFVKPDWIGREVTGASRYFNSNLITHPFNRWSENEK
ncbi:MAG: CYTH domain-containing protein [Candidatus Marinimicrobia bacterium]|jgi:CYTH domain-containing protein|nr:CYTH domain-containing protein [Candidatus Neomarinimicrobiota bacterium]